MIFKKSIPWIVLLACLSFMIYQMSLIQVPLDTGDGVQHFFIANYALEHPVLLLNHWGKPFFTLLASPFSYLGLTGIIGLNLILFCITCTVGFLCFNQLKVSYLLQPLLPIALLFSYDYTLDVLAGLTEILAACMILISGYFLVKRKWMWMAVCISILPFCRSEGQLIVILGVLVLLYNKQYKFLPFLLTAFIIYSSIGYFAFDDFLWYFNQNPYRRISIYGHGEWAHFWNLKDQYLGQFGLILTVLGGLSILYLVLKRQLSSVRIDFVFFGIASFLGIVLVHAYLWAYGLRGSLGLTRVLLFGLPIFLVVMIYCIQQFQFRNKYIRYSYILLLPILVYIYYPKLLQVTKNTGIDKSVLDASNFIQRVKPKESKVFYIHPLFALGMGLNTLKPNPSFQMQRFDHENEHFEKLDYGDFIVRDSHFGPNEMGLPLSVVKSSEELVLVNEIIPSQPGSSYHGEKWSVRIYQKIPKKYQRPITQSEEPIQLEITSYTIQPQREFEDIITYKIGGNTSFIELEFEADQSGGYLVCDVNNGQKWSTIPLKKGKNSGIKFPVKQNDSIKLYFWNPDKHVNTVRIINVFQSKVNFHPIYNKK